MFFVIPGDTAAMTPAKVSNLTNPSWKLIRITSTSSKWWGFFRNFTHRMLRHDVCFLTTLYCFSVLDMRWWWFHRIFMQVTGLPDRESFSHVWLLALWALNYVKYSMPSPLWAVPWFHMQTMHVFGGGGGGRERWYSIRWHSESNIPMQKSDLNILFWCQILLTYEYFFKLFIPTFHKIGEGQKNLLTMVGAWVTFLLYARIQ